MKQHTFNPALTFTIAGKSHLEILREYYDQRDAEYKRGIKEGIKREQERAATEKATKGLT